MSLAPKSIKLALEDGWPVGYLRPQGPVARLLQVATPFSGTICTVAFFETGKSEA
jgi:hypothetical protein